MKTLQHIILWLTLATFGASTAHAAANDIQISQRNPQNTAWVDRIFAPASGTSFSTASGFLNAIGGISSTTVNGYFADPSTNGSFSPVTWRGDLGLASISTDNAIVRFDGLTGQTKNSGITITDSNVLAWATGNASVTATGSSIFTSNVPFKIGSAVAVRYGTFTAAETVNAAKLDVNGYHAYEDFNQIVFDTGSPIFPAYASIDLRPVATGSILANHFVGLQSRPVYSGSGGISTYFDAINTTAVHDGAGTILGAAGLKINALGGTGPVTTNYGILVKAMASRANVGTAWPIYVEDGISSLYNLEARSTSEFKDSINLTGSSNSFVKSGTGFTWTATGLSGTLLGGIYANASGVTIFGGSSAANRHVAISPTGVVGITQVSDFNYIASGSGWSWSADGLTGTKKGGIYGNDTGLMLFGGTSTTPQFTLSPAGAITMTGSTSLTGAFDHYIRSGQGFAWTSTGASGTSLGGIYANSGGTVIYGGSNPAANRVSISNAGAVTLDVALPPGSGGTGQTTYTNGQLLIGNTTGNTLTKATLTAGPGVSVTNGTGSITVGQSGMSTLRTGTATLVAGTVTVADASTAATTRIRLSMVTPGGTVGAQYISAKVNSTSFTITSTSALDTSVVYYEAFEP